MKEPSVVTMLETPPASSRSLEARSAATADSVVTPEQAMLRVEARRAWSFSLGLSILCAIAVVVIAKLGGDPLAQRLHGATVGATGLAALANVAFNRDARRYRPWLMILMTAISIVADLTGYLYWGVYSAFCGVVSVSGYGFASGTNRRRVVLVITAAVVLGHTALGVAQLLGWIGNRAWVEPQPGIPPLALVGILAVLQVITVGAILGGVDARATVQRVLDEHHAALRALSQRDAQLAEAHEAERQARAPGEGRHTGQRLGRFQLGVVLGRGAMGEVYAASDEAGAPYAVKVLAASLLENEDAMKRFYREARVVANVASPHIVRMVEVSPQGAALPWIAMEQLAGRDLGAILKERPVRALDEVVSIVGEVAAGLDAAHEAGVVHRDLKPANVFAAQTGDRVTWKVLDFGVSKLFDDNATLTADHVVGTPGYMSPEQARGDATLDRRADVYALGVVAYRLLTGRPAVVPGDLPSMLHEVVYRMPPKPGDAVPMSDRVERVLAIALAKSPDDRFATAGELARALAAASRGELPADLVARGDAVLRRTPWGAWLRRAPSKSVRPAAPSVG